MQVQVEERKKHRTTKLWGSMKVSKADLPDALCGQVQVVLLGLVSTSGQEVPGSVEVWRCGGKGTYVEVQVQVTHL